MSKLDTKKKTFIIHFVFLIAFTTTICEATTYTSTQNGDWDDPTAWGGSAPTSLSNDDIVSILVGDTITYTGTPDYMVNKITINVSGVLFVPSPGVFSGKNNLTINVLNGGDVEIYEFDAGTDAKITINVLGEMSVNNDMTFGNNANVTVNGTLNITGNISAGNSSVMSGGGNVVLGGSCSPSEDPFCTDGPLPVELIHYSALQYRNKVLIEWSTASELNNDFFTIERSSDGAQFEILSIIEGNGTTKSTHNYQYTDLNPLLGLSYYRLSQTDYDGTTEQFPLVSILYIPESNQLSVYPNPFEDGIIHLRSSRNFENETVTLRITDIQGRLVYKNLITADTFGNIDQEIIIDNLASKNTYILELISKSEKETIKLLSN